MNRFVAGAVAGAIVALGGSTAALGGQDALREVLRQQSAAQHEGCLAIKRTLATERNAALVVRSAVEIGFNSCLAIRCAIEGGGDLAQVIQGAGEAGVQADVVARCAVEAGADRAAVARVLSDLAFDASFCYVTFSPAGAPEPQAPVQPIIERDYDQPRAQASTFTF